MARPLRLEFPGAVYHVTSRGNARQDIVADDRDRSQFLTLLAHVVDRYGWRCHAYWGNKGVRNLFNLKSSATSNRPLNSSG